MRLDGSWRLGAVAAAVCAAGCSGSGSDGGRLVPSTDGTLSISLIDVPFAEADAIYVQITSVRVKPSGDGPALEFPLDPPLEPNLLDLTLDNAETLLAGEPVPAGDYNWIELEVSAELDGELDSYVITKNGGQEELRVPSGSLRLVSGFTVTANQETSFVIDWDTRQGLVRPPGLNGYLLRPAFRILDSTERGTLSGTVAAGTILNDADWLPATGCGADDPDLDVGNAIYVFAEHGVEPDDIDGNEPEPVATVTVEPGLVDYDYSTILSPGAYTIALTCQAGHDDPETDEPALSEVDEPTVAFSEPRSITIEADVEAVEDF